MASSSWISRISSLGIARRGADGNRQRAPTGPWRRGEAACLHGLTASIASRPTCRLLPKSSGNSAGGAIPIAARAATASALRPACQAGQQRECSQTWPVGSMPWGSSAIVRHDRRHRRRGSVPAASARSCGSAIRRRSRRRRGLRPRGAAGRHRTRRCRPARRKTPASPRPTSRRGRAAAAPRCPPCDATEDRGRGGRRRVSLQHQVVAVDPKFDAGGRAAFRASAALIAAPSSRAVFPGADWGGRFASAPSAAVPPLVFNGLARTVATGSLRRYRPHRWQPSAGRAPRSHWPDWISAWARTMRTVRTVAPRPVPARNGSGWW